VCVSRRYWFAFAAVLGAYVLHQVLTRTLNFDTPEQLQLLRPFDVDSERSIANWLGTVGWFAGATVLWRADRRVLAVLLGLLSIEEMVDHRDVVADFFPRSLVLASAALVIVVAAWAARSLPPGAARRLLPGVACWAIATKLVDELARIWFWAGTASYDLAVGIEEGLELAGIGLVLAALERTFAAGGSAEPVVGATAHVR
jgi:hypothetical protein